MSTEKVDGFRLDRIGQFLSTSYPELRLTPGLDALVLRPFAPGSSSTATAATTTRAPRRPEGAHGAHSTPYAPWRAPPGRGRYGRVHCGAGR